MTDLTRREAASAAKEAIEQLCEIAETTTNDLKAAQVECANLHNKWTSAQADVNFWKVEGTRVQQKLDDVTRQNKELRVERDEKDRQRQGALDQVERISRQRDELTAERDAMREHIKNLEAEVAGLRQSLSGSTPDDGMQYRMLKGNEIILAGDEYTTSVQNPHWIPVEPYHIGAELFPCNEGRWRRPISGPTENTSKPPEISPEYARQAVKETFGDTLYDAFMRGARAEIIGELQAKDEERFPR